MIASCNSTDVRSAYLFLLYFRWVIMDAIEDFEAVFGTNQNVAYDSQALEKIRRNRRSLEGELFVDRLLKALGVQESRKAPYLQLFQIRRRC